MKHQAALLITTVMLAGSAFAEDPIPAADEYAWGWEISTNEENDFYELALPMEVYRSTTDARARDTGIYNANGMAVPRVLYAPAPVAASEQRVTLPALPLYRDGSDKPEDIELSLLRDGQKTIVNLNTSDREQPDAALYAYIVDVDGLDHKLERLELEWQGSPEPFIGRVRVEASDDLDRWTTVGSGAIAALQHDDARVEQRAVELKARKSRYLKLTWSDVPTGWSLARITGVYHNQPQDLTRQRLVLSPTSTAVEDSGVLFDAGGTPLVDRLNLGLPADNSVLRAAIYARQAETDPWHLVQRGTFYHLRSSGEGLESTPLTVAPRRARYWKVVTEQGRQDGQFSLELQWRADKVVFVAQGEPPYRLVSGRARDSLEGFPQHKRLGSSTLGAMLKSIDRQAGAAILGPRYSLGGPGQLEISTAPDWRTWLLWLALGGGVVVAGLMALSLLRQLGNE